MGGPLWARREARAWSIVKGEYEEGEEPLAAARREFREETGAEPPDGPAVELGEVHQSGGKRVIAWAIEGDFDPAALRPGTFTMQWPPRSGRVQEFPEIDRVEWCDPASARELLVAGQVALLDRLEELLASGS
jgi:predicted NUDIX family NTP pyrophosphohydrolase